MYPKQVFAVVVVVCVFALRAMGGEMGDPITDPVTPAVITDVTFDGNGFAEAWYTQVWSDYVTARFSWPDTSCIASGLSTTTSAISAKASSSRIELGLKMTRTTCEMSADAQASASFMLSHDSVLLVNYLALGQVYSANIKFDHDTYQMGYSGTELSWSNYYTASAGLHTFAVDAHTFNGNTDIYAILTVVPEPATIGILGVGMSLLALRRNKSRR